MEAKMITVIVKLKNIALGWYLFLFGKRTQQANNRVDICNDCVFRKGYFCGVCWCEIHAKASIPEEQCPKNKWSKESGMRITQKTW